MLKKGEVLAFKTDTVWGFGADVFDIDGVKNIYKIKNRDSLKPLILMSNEFSSLEKFIKKIPPYAYELIEKYLPGALTLIFEKSDICPDYVTSNSPTVGVRVPNSPDFKQALDYSGLKVLATTSCNISNTPPVKNYSEAKKLFSNKATIIKPITEDLSFTPSTVILCNENDYKILRNGAVKL